MRSLSARTLLHCSLYCFLTACGNTGDTTAVKTDTARTTVTVKGKVDAIDNTLGLLDGSVSVGTDIMAVYTVDTAPPPSQSQQLTSAHYFDAFRPGDVTITVGNYKFTSTSVTQLTIADGLPNADGLFDGWYLNAPKASVTGPAISADLTAFISYYDPTATALSSTTIMAAPQLTSWSSKRIGISRVDLTGGHLFIAGEVTEITLTP